MPDCIGFPEIKSFSCTGGDCPFHCCMNWDIYIDKHGYDVMLENYPDFEDKYYTKLDASDDDYGQIIMNECDVCPYIDGDGLCKIQKKLGHDALPERCRHFPRYNHLIAGRHEVGISLSCPRAAEILLYAPGSLKRQEIEWDPGDNIDYAESFQGRAFPYEKIMSAIDEILSYPQGSIYERLLVLGNFCRMLDRHEGDDENGYSSAADAFMSGIDGRISGITESVRQKNYNGDELLRRCLLFLSVGCENCGMQKVENYMRGALQGLNMRPGDGKGARSVPDVPFAKKAVREAVSRYFTSGEGERVIERYISCGIMQRFVYFADHSGRFAPSYYALMNMLTENMILAAGRISRDGGFDREGFLEGVYCFSRLCLHSDYIAKATAAIESKYIRSWPDLFGIA